MDDLPRKTMNCESRVIGCEDIVEKVKQGFEMLQQSVVQMENDKADKKVFDISRLGIEKRMTGIETTFDGLNDKNKSLENWMDIYVPLRTQHQITETMKECLSTKGKHILGIVDNIMCNTYRERVFTDVGKSNIKSRCFDVIAKLRAQADSLVLEQCEDDVSEAVKDYRDKVFTDIGKEQIKDKVLDVLKGIQVDDHMIGPDSVNEIKRQVINYDKWHAGL
jgi:hypothetical protein